VPDRSLVFVIEDHPNMRDTLCRVIESDGMRALGIGDPTQVLSNMKKHQPDAVILDVDLGASIDGVDLLRMIKAHPRLMGTAVILHTSESNISMLPETARADLILIKPADPDHISRLVKRVIKKKQMQSQG
jgi:DNA-binding NtrC family response regulator